MGATKMNLTQLELNQSEEITLKLTDPARPFKDLGEIKIIATLMPKTQEDKEQVCVEGRTFFLLLIFLSFPPQILFVKYKDEKKLSMFGM